jgi:hypothetical protein
MSTPLLLDCEKPASSLPFAGQMKAMPLGAAFAVTTGG